MTLSIRRMIESTAPREPYVPEPEMGGIGGGRGRGGRDRDRDRETEGGPAGPPREGGGGTPAGPPRERRRRDSGGGGGRSRGGGDYNVESEEDHREYRNYRANQREETFGTSLGDILSAQLSSLREATNEDSADAVVTPAEAEEEK